MAEPSEATHLEHLTIAELDAGGLDAEQAAAATAHLADCASCQAVRTDLAELSGLLAAAPSPQLPPAVAERIDDALSAAAAARETSTGTSGAVVVPLASRRGRWLAPLAAAAAVVAAIGIVGQVVRSPSGEDAASSADAQSTFREGGGEDAGAEAASPDLSKATPLELSSKSFRRDLTRQLTGVSSSAPGPHQLPATTDQYQAQVCPAPSHIAGRGEPLPALLDGRQALLYLSGPRSDLLAVAVTCERGVATVAARTRLDLD